MSNNITKFLNSRVIELSSQKIELGVMQDMQKLTDIVKNESKELRSVMPKLKSIATEAYNSPATALQNLKKSIDIFSKDAVSLGLKPSEFSSFNEAEDLYKKTNSDLDAFYKDVLKHLLK